jgi:hypothetical protein
LVNKLLGAFNKLISNFSEGSILELALCILKDNAQLLFNLTIKVVFESCLKSMLMILSGRFICGVLNLGSIVYLPIRCLYLNENRIVIYRCWRIRQGV